MTRIEQAQAAVDAARAVLADLDSLSRAPREEVAELLACSAELSRVLDAQRVRLAGEIVERSKGPDEQSICRLLGHRSAKEAVASAFGIRAGDARALLALAAATRPAIGLSGGDIAAKYPRIARALDEGGLSLPQAHAIAGTLEPAAPRADLEQLAWAEGALVDAATDPTAPLVPELLVTQARAYVAVLDPDGMLPDAERQRTLRALRWRRRPDGGLRFTLDSTDEDGAALIALLDAETGPRVAFRNTTAPTQDDDSDSSTDRDDDSDSSNDSSSDSSSDSDSGNSSDGDADASGDNSDCDSGRGGPVDDRTLAQQRHDVLIGLARAHAASGNAPTVGGEPPVLVLHGDLAAYTAYLQGVTHPDRGVRIEHTGTIVPIETMERLLCHAQVQPVLVDEHLHPLALGRARRLFTPAQRRALAVRDQGCRVPDCRMPAAWCEVHHIQWWERGGPTDIDNGILVCSYHHHEIHAGRLHVEQASPTPGHWRIIPELHPADRYARNRRTGHTPTTAQPDERTLASIRRAADGDTLDMLHVPPEHASPKSRPSAALATAERMLGAVGTDEEVSAALADGSAPKASSARPTPASRRSTAQLRAEAPASLALKLPATTDAIAEHRARRRQTGPPIRPRWRRSPIEDRLLPRFSGRHLASRTPPIDRHPPAGIVLRT